MNFEFHSDELEDCTIAAVGLNGTEYFAGKCLKDLPLLHMHDPNMAMSKADIAALILAITEQTKAIRFMAESNQALVQAMIESGDVGSESNPNQTLD